MQSPSLPDTDVSLCGEHMTDSNMSNAADEEFDFSNDGMQPIEGVFVVTNFESQDKDKGTQHKITLESESLPFPVYLTGWVKHENPKAAAVGRSILKRFATAALGNPGYTAATILGARVLGTASEDDNGFVRIGKFKPAPAEEAVS